MTYEYQCVGCQHHWEAEQKITEPPLTHCPECGAEKARRLISRSTFLLQGRGWFKTGGYILPFFLMLRSMVSLA